MLLTDVRSIEHSALTKRSSIRRLRRLHRPTSCGQLLRRLGFSLLLLAPLAARADNLVSDPGAPWPVSVDLPRATAMGGAQSAIATSNDALAVNPAGLSQSKRYHFELGGIYDAHYPAQGVLASIVDSASSPVGSGILFSRWGSGQPAGRGA